jgi:predicted GIY-YIG superfamily endonuclease
LGGAKQGAAAEEDRGRSVRYVYLLQSLSHPEKRYVGITTDLNKRLVDHNAGRSPHTAKFTPWKCVVAIRFEDGCKADEFEAYLKQGSGHAFAKRHFW